MTPLFRRLPIALTLLGALVAATNAFAVPPGFRVLLMRTDLNWPACIRFAPDGRLFYLEYFTGRIMVYPTVTSSAPEVWATLPVAVGGDRGLPGMAFHPDYPDSDYIYFFHTNDNPEVNRIVRFHDDGLTGSGLVVLRDDIPSGAYVHYGGRIEFGPDHMLYVTYGDQLHAQYAQDINHMEGKLFRFTPMGETAPGNPYSATNPAYAKGIRNAFGLCFDPLIGTGYFTINGQECDDTVDRLVPGGNYGWSENYVCGSPPAWRQPSLLRFSTTIAPTGCTVYRGGLYPSNYEGNLFFGSWDDGAIRRVTFVPGDPTTLDSVEVFHQFGEGVIDVTVDNNGRLWAATASKLYVILEPGAVLAAGSPTPRPQLSVAPNPSYGSVTFGLPGKDRFDRLDVVDLAGRVVREWSGPIEGSVQWDGRAESGFEAPAGVYWVRAYSPDVTLTRRVLRIPG
jgi:quinoprotein glucose dehydrogenase